MVNHFYQVSGAFVWNMINNKSLEAREVKLGCKREQKLIREKPDWSSQKRTKKLWATQGNESIQGRTRDAWLIYYKDGSHYRPTMHRTNNPFHSDQWVPERCESSSGECRSPGGHSPIFASTLSEATFHEVREDKKSRKVEHPYPSCDFIKKRDWKGDGVRSERVEKPWVPHSSPAYDWWRRPDSSSSFVSDVVHLWKSKITWRYNRVCRTNRSQQTVTEEDFVPTRCTSVRTLIDPKLVSWLTFELTFLRNPVDPETHYVWFENKSLKKGETPHFGNNVVHGFWVAYHK